MVSTCLGGEAEAEGDVGPHPGTPVRAAPSPGELALDPEQPGVFPPGKARNLQHLARGQRSGHDYAPVDADGIAIAGSRDMLGDGGERDVPASRAVPGAARRMV